MLFNYQLINIRGRYFFNLLGHYDEFETICTSLFLSTNSIMEILYTPEYRKM